jgi:4-diphosphocytidyl-2-C-methyl-D-erythritol kinase
MNSLRLQPNAKINLGLIIKGRRPDGYHLLETVFIPLTELQDTLTLQKADTWSLSVEGLEIDSKGSDNLVAKAHRLLSSAVGMELPVKAVLEKRIPAGAGLGGGSSDAAAMLKGLNTLFELKYPDETLALLGAELGADVPFFIYNKPLLAKGIGTEFEPIEIGFPFRIEIETPAIHSSTVEAYKSLDLAACHPGLDLRQILSLPPSEWKSRLPNDLEGPVFHTYPELAKIKADFYKRGAVYASMSGSGSALYGLFKER